MESWPAQADYRDALQNPEAVFGIEELRTCRAEANKIGVPRARSGAFASVYKLQGPSGAKALKLFNFPSTDRQRRYEAVEAYFRKLEADRKKPKCLIPCRYEPDGIYIKNNWYPIQTMDWVKGQSLAEWLRVTMQTKNVKAIRAMADAWAELVAELQQAKIAHGDLQHDNVMVVNNVPVLVDYDGMCVPGLEGADQLEFGKPAYQHPKRNEQKLNFGLDNFSAWIILVSLRAVANDTSLYQKFVTEADNEALLFLEDDLHKPAKSPLWPLLMASLDKEVAAWAKELRTALDRPFSAIPPFTLDPFRTMRTLAAAKVKDWNALADEGARISGLPNVPQDLSALGDEARKRVAARDKLRDALQAGDMRAAAAAYRPELLDDWNEAFPLVKQAQAARDKATVLETIAAAAKSPGDGRALVALWDKSGAALQGVKGADAYRAEAESWRAKLRAADRFLTVAKNTSATDQAIVEAWAEVSKAGSHPSITEAHRQQAETAALRIELLRKLNAIPTAPSDEGDRSLVRLCENPVLDGRTDAAKFHARVGPARERLAVLDRLTAAVREADASGREEPIIDIAGALPPNYVHKLADRVRRAQSEVQLRGALSVLWDADKPSDVRIAEAWEKYRAQPGGGRNAAAHVADRCKLAVQRRDALRELERIDKDESAKDRQDFKWLQSWKTHQALLQPSPDAASLRSRIELAMRRYKAWQALKKALDADDLAGVRRLAADPELAGYPPLVRERDRIADITIRADRIDRLMQQLQQTGHSVLSAEDLAFVRANHTHFSDTVKEQIRRLIEDRLRNGAKLRAGKPAFQVIPGIAPLVRVNWGWSETGLLSCCRIAHDRARHLDDPSQADPYASSECRHEDHQRFGGGFMVIPPPGSGRVFVTVWPVVELGWTDVTGPPLHVGPVPLGSGEGKKR